MFEIKLEWWKTVTAKDYIKLLSKIREYGNADFDLYINWEYSWNWHEWKETFRKLF